MVAVGRHVYAVCRVALVRVGNSVGPIRDLAVQAPRPEAPADASS